MKKVKYAKFYQAVKVGRMNETYLEEKRYAAAVPQSVIDQCMIIDAGSEVIYVPITNIPFFVIEKEKKEAEEKKIKRK